MIDLILFVLILIAGGYAISTRARLINLAKTADEINLQLAETIKENQERIKKLEEKNRIKKN